VESYGLFSAIASEITMTTSLKVLEAEALKLAPADRSHLLERLIASLDTDPEVEEAWEMEADRREASLESGSAAEVPAQEAMNRFRSRLADEWEEAKPYDEDEAKPREGVLRTHEKHAR